ncbi:discoidin domain-containing protein [Bacteriovoracaceae bacterium]|nr:discoidin domain-containing protein [Bacteriovoracaceae bacterium]
MIDSACASSNSLIDNLIPVGPFAKHEHSVHTAKESFNCDPETYWTSGMSYWKGSGKEGYLGFNYGEQTTIGQYEFYQNNSKFYASTFWLESSNDGVSWTRIPGTKKGKNNRKGIKYVKASHVKMDFPEVTAQYFRLYIVKSFGWPVINKLRFGRIGSQPHCLSWEYEANDRTLVISLNSVQKWKYVFNPGGAISEMYDLSYSSNNNLIASSFMGETSDRVIQWTYWNSNYISSDNPIGNGGRRANVTMEGGWHDWELASVKSSPASTTSGQLVFVSAINSWFYSNLDSHGKPDFETTSTYEILEDGSLKLTRKILRMPWIISNYYYQDKDGKEIYQNRGYTFATGPDNMECESNGSRGSLTSYLEGWTPFKRTYLPDTETATGNKLDQTNGGHYGNPDPTGIGGWVMAKNDEIGVAVVFGNGTEGVGDLKVVFNSIYSDRESPNDLNIVLPGVEATWPENKTMTQTLIFVMGELEDVRTRAEILKGSVPIPTVK